MGNTPISGHLGGFIEGGNLATWGDVVWNYLIEQYNITSMIDVGCGAGYSLRYFLDKGIDAWGTEGYPNIQQYAVCPLDRIHVVDYEEEAYVPDREFDFVWSCEFVEHVSDENKNNFLKTFEKGKYIGMTYAVPGQSGHNHVNCNTEEFWVNVLKEYGFTHNEKVSKNMRDLIGTTNYGQHIRATFLFFEKL